jgi:hypothetical protein
VIRATCFIFGFPILGIIIALLTGCADMAVCQLDEPAIVGGESYIINGEVSVDRRQTVYMITSGCTGVAVGPHTVVSAQHCNPAPGDFVAYQRDLASGDGSWTFLTVIEVHDHHYTDVSVVITAGDPIDVSPHGYATIGVPNGCYPGLIAQGYGRSEDGPGDGVLRERVVYQTSVNRAWLIHTTEGSCLGDSGGPLYARTPEGFSVIGIASQVRKHDCTSGLRFAARYTDITTNIGDWIKERTQDER